MNEFVIRDELQLAKEVGKRVREEKERLRQENVDEELLERNIARLEDKATDGDADSAIELVSIYSSDGSSPDAEKKCEWKAKALELIERRVAGGDGVYAYELARRQRNLKKLYGLTDYSEIRSIRNKWLKRAEPLLIKQLENDDEKNSVRRILTAFYARYYNHLYENEDECVGFQKALALWQDLADRGDSEAHYQIGRIHERYSVAENCLQTAMEWYGRAAKNGNVNAMEYIGESYLEYDDGDGWPAIVGKDAKKAVPYLEKAAILGSDAAAKKLSEIYYKGVIGSGIRVDYAKAIHWQKRAIQLQDEKGRVETNTVLNLIYYYFKTKGAGQNQEKAFKMLLEFAPNEEEIREKDCDEWVCEMLGICYLFGRGVERDYKKSFYWKTLAYENGTNYSFTILNLGNMYETGKGVKKDLAKAIDLYKQSAHQRCIYSIKDLRTLIFKNKFSAKELFDILIKNAQDYGYGEIEDADERAELEKECSVIESQGLYLYYIDLYLINRFAVQNSIEFSSTCETISGSIVCFLLDLSHSRNEGNGESRVKKLQNLGNLKIEATKSDRQKLIDYAVKKLKATLNGDELIIHGGSLTINAQ